MKARAKSHKRKMSKEELETYIKAKRQGNGRHKSKKDYNRKNKVIED